MQHAKIFFYIFLSKSMHKKKGKKIQAIHIHSKICKRPKTLIYIKNKFPKAKLYSHKIQSVHLNPNPITKKSNKSVSTRRPQFWKPKPITVTMTQHPSFSQSLILPHSLVSCKRKRLEQHLYTEATTELQTQTNGQLALLSEKTSKMKTWTESLLKDRLDCKGTSLVFHFLDRALFRSQTQTNAAS